MPRRTQRHRSSKNATSRRTIKTKLYKDHQRYVVDFLINQCPQQDGIVLYHYMGCGKTHTAVGLIENYAMPTVVLAPKGLLGMWRNEYVKEYGSVLPKDVTCYSYDAFWDAMDNKTDAWRQNRVLVVDEAHNLSQWLSSRLPVHRRTPCLKKLFQFRKRVLLTGTPIYWSERDLAFLVNVCRGEAVIPIDPNMFRQKYYKVKKIRADMEGWMVPLLRMSWKTIGVSGLAALSSGVANTFMAPGTVRKILELIQKATVSYVTTPWFYAMRRRIGPLVAPVMKLLGLDGNVTAETFHQKLSTLRTQKKRIDLVILYFKTTLEGIAEDNREEIEQNAKVGKAIQKKKAPHKWLDKEMAKIRANLSTLDYMLSYRQEWIDNKLKYLQQVPAFKELVEEYNSAGLMVSTSEIVQPVRDPFERTQIERMLRQVRINRKLASYEFWEPVYIAFTQGSNLKFAKQAPVLLVTFVLFLAITLIVKCFLMRSTDIDLLELNYDHLVSDIAPYISYYEPGHSHESRGRTWREWLLGSGPKPADSFPNIARPAPKTVGYNAHQTALFIRFTIGKLSFVDYAELTIIRNISDGMTTSFDQTSGSNFRQFGRMIGNVCTFHNKDEHTPVSYAEALRYNDATHQCEVLVPFSSVAPKFERLAAYIQKHPNKRRVVYSNFSAAASSLSAYLALKGIKHKFLRDPPTFAQAGNTRTRKQSSRAGAVTGSDAEYKAILKWVNANPDGLLLLDQSYSEGISILEVDEFHLLDPCDSVAKNEQAKARVVRLDSHSDPNATVTIVEWLSTLSLVRKFLASLPEWRKHRAFVCYTDMLSDHKQTITPDAMVHAEVHRLAKSTLKVVKLLQKKSVEHYATEGVPKQCRARGCQIAQVSKSASALKGTCAEG